MKKKKSTHKPIQKPKRTPKTKASVKKTVQKTVRKPKDTRLKSLQDYSFRQKLIAYGITLLLSFGLYANTISFGYVFDDPIVVTQNKFTTNEQFWHGLKKIFQHDSFAGIFGEHGGIIAGGRYRPLSVATFAVEWHLFAEGHQLTNRSLQILQEEKVPKNVLQNLGKIVNKKYETKAAFNKALLATIGESNVQQYGSEILDSTKHTIGTPHISHFINVLLYAFSGMLIFNIFVKLFSYQSQWNSLNKKKWLLSIPFVAAVLWIAHPIHTEVVANIKERDDIMALLGGLLALFYVLRYLETNKPQHLIYSSSAFFLGLLSKENTITFYAVIPLCMYFFTSKKAKEYFKVLAPLLGVTIVFLIIRYQVLGVAAQNNIPNKLMNDPFLYATFGEKYATIFYTLGHYIRLLLFPHPLTVDYYPFRIPLINWLDWRAIISLLFYVGMGVYAILRIKQRDFFAFGIWFYLITFSIVSNIFFPIGTYMSERFMYIPSIAFCLILVYALFHKLPEYLAQKNENLNSKKLLVPLAVIFIVFLGSYSAKTIVRNEVWKSDFDLFSSSLSQAHRAAKTNHVLGELYLMDTWKMRGELAAEKDPAKKQELKEKIQDYLEKSVKYSKIGVDIHPRYVRCNHNLAVALYEMTGNIDTAMYYFYQTLKNQPYYQDSHAYLQSKVYTKLDDVDKKIEILEKIHKIVPLHYKTASLLGTYYLVKDQRKKAKKMLDLAVRIEQHGSDFNNLGVMYNRNKNYPKAAEMFEKAVKYSPQSPQYWVNLGMTYKTLGRAKDSEQCFLKAQQLKKQ